MERHEAFEVFIDLFLPLVCCLEEMKDSVEFNHSSRSDAQSFLFSLCCFLLIVTLAIVTEVLQYTKALSIKLQGRYIDIVHAYREVTLVKSTLKNARERSIPFTLESTTKQNKLLHW